MVSQSAGSDLGARTDSFPVDDGRRLGQGIGCLVVGAVPTVVGVMLSAAYVANANSSGFSPLPGAILGLGLVLLFFGGLRLTQRLTRPDERFDLHEHGFVHRTSRGERAIRWADVAKVRHLGSYRDGGLAHSFGVDYRCVVELRDKSKIRFDTLTDRADVLGSKIDRHTSPQP
ncbi:hypothetical protein O7632_26240 [Solwaraspora sp. WMMD406]|uniref:hypothetical protein n=1 Tax=Solwaraspora sp. WMMD406 TaxID=3016095 RepID=UPI002416FB4B|nr:hypothetical protein [Solwaraspora sp. WMMD406]MDG4767564.1 hypothetical protein [Solwaraspora sp. WMMD406]